MHRVLLVESRDSVRRQLLLALRRDGIEAEAVSGAEAARNLLMEGKIDVVALGYDSAPVPEILQLILGLAGAGAGAPPEVVVYLATDDREAGLTALRQGAADFVCLPSAGPAALGLALLKLEARRAAAAGGTRDRRWERGGPAAPRAGAGEGTGAEVGTGAGEGGPRPGSGAPTLVGSNPRMTALAATIRKLAGARATVLIGGESGTGKELVAQALHRESPWSEGPFVPVNCGAISPGLIESELFGHVRGAFTDAVRDKVGLFESADGGTLFLDEIADLPVGLQPKLLRAIQEGEVRRVGDVEDHHVQVRVVAATARDLLAEVAAGRFREDLYYRLSALSLRIPPLRDRRDDIPRLAAHFLERVRRRLGVVVDAISAEAMQVLVAHGWPGNVRELENTIERAAVMCTGREIDIASLPERLHETAARLFATGDGPPSRPRAAEGAVALGGAAGVAVPVPVELPAGDAGAQAGDDLSIKRAARRTEEVLIRRALGRTLGNRTRAAELLEISPRALLYKIKEYGILDKGAPANGDGEGTGNDEREAD
jgi:two-component system response regulator AtoC